MLGRMRKLGTDICTSHRVAAPASTLLLATAFALMVGFVTRSTFAQPGLETMGQVWTSESAWPGGPVDVAVEGAAGQRLVAYLPGLSGTKVVLSYDRSTGIHSGRLFVPSTAPGQGYFTLRVVTPNQLEEDLRIQLVRDKTPDDS